MIMTAPSNWKVVNTPMTARKIDESLVEMMRFVVHHYLDCNHKLGGTTKSSKPLSEVEQITGVNYGDMLSSVFLIEKTKKQKQKYLVEIFPRFLCQGIIQNSVDILKQSEVKGLTPPPVQETYLTQLLIDKECICGTDLSSNKQALETITALKEKVKTSQIAELATEGKVLLGGMLDFKSKEETSTLVYINI